MFSLRKSDPTIAVLHVFSLAVVTQQIVAPNSLRPMPDMRTVSAHPFGLGCLYFARSRLLSQHVIIGDEELFCTKPDFLIFRSFHMFMLLYFQIVDPFCFVIHTRPAHGMYSMKHENSDSTVQCSRARCTRTDKHLANTEQSAYAWRAAVVHTLVSRVTLCS